MVNGPIRPPEPRAPAPRPTGRPAVAVRAVPVRPARAPAAPPITSAPSPAQQAVARARRGQRLGRLTQSIMGLAGIALTSALVVPAVAPTSALAPAWWGLAGACILLALVVTLTLVRLRAQTRESEDRPLARAARAPLQFDSPTEHTEG